MKKQLLIMSLLFAAALNCQALAAIPVLNSLPGAPMNIVLDFHGDSSLTSWRMRRSSSFYATFKQTGGVPEFSHTHSLYSKFLSSEAKRNALINDVWTCVADRFSMYNVNVTTDKNLRNLPGQSVRVVFDDNGDDWRRDTPTSNIRLDFTTSQNCIQGGVAGYNTIEGGATQPGSTSYFEFRTAEIAAGNTPPDNICMVFARGDMWLEDSWGSVCSSPSGSWPQIARYLAHTACHELTHMLGWNPDNGAATSVLHPHTEGPSPGMRSGWSSPSAVLPAFITFIPMTIAEKNLYSFQENMGLRSGEEGNAIASAVNMGYFNSSQFDSRHGIIHTQVDDDWFRIQLSDPDTKLRFHVRPRLLFSPLPVSGIRWHAVDVKIGLYNKNGALIQQVNPSGETLAGWQPEITYDTKQSPELPDDLYYFKIEPAENDGVRGHGDLGQYVITVETTPSP